MINATSTAETGPESSSVQSSIDAWKEMLVQGKTEEVRQALRTVGDDIIPIWDKADMGFKIFPQTADPANVSETLSQLVSRELGRRDFEIYQKSRASALAQ